MKKPCTKTFFVAYFAAGCKAGLIFHATSNFCDISCWIGSVYSGLCPGMKAWSLLQRTFRAIHWPPWFQCLGNSSCNMTCDRVLETVEAVASQKRPGQTGRMPFARQCGWVFTSTMKPTSARCHRCHLSHCYFCKKFCVSILHSHVKSSSLYLIWTWRLS